MYTIIKVYINKIELLSDWGSIVRSEVRRHGLNRLSSF